MTEAGYTTMTELVKVQSEYDAILYNDIADIVRNRKVRVVHLISVPRDFVFSAQTGPEYLKLNTTWYMIDDSYSLKNSLLHLVMKNVFA